MRELITVLSGSRAVEFDFQGSHFWDLKQPVGPEDLLAADAEDRRLVAGVPFVDERGHPIRYQSLHKTKCGRYVIVGSMHFDPTRAESENCYAIHFEIPKATARQLLLKSRRSHDRSGRYDLPEDLQQPFAEAPGERTIEKPGSEPVGVDRPREPVTHTLPSGYQSCSESTDEGVCRFDTTAMDCMGTSVEEATEQASAFHEEACIPITVDTTSMTVNVGGFSHTFKDRDRKVFQAYKRIVEANGDRLTGSELDKGRIDRKLGKLPPELRATFGSKSSNGGGYFLTRGYSWKKVHDRP